MVTITKKYFFGCAVLVTGALILNLYCFNSEIIGVVLAATYLFTASLLAHSIISKKYELNIIWSFLSVIFGFTIIGTIIYYACGISKVASAAMLATVFFLYFHAPHEISIKLPKIEFEKSKILYLTVLAFFASEIAIFRALFLNQTTEVMNSPWLALGPWFFITYAIATGLVISTVLKSKNKILQLSLTSIHLFATYAVAVIIYKLGFGFDGFIHRATEVWIQNNGFITPKQPMYIGQYSLVVWLSNITKIPIFYIDAYLVPVLASISLPAVISSSLEKAWSIPKKIGVNLVWIFPFIFFLSLHLTTPHNMLILLSIITVFAVIEYTHEKTTAVIPILLSVAGIATHALLGAPIFTLVTTVILLKFLKNKKNIPWVILLIYFFAIASLFPILFTVYIYATGHGLPTITNPINKISQFIELFQRPYWYEQTSPLRFELVYFWQRLTAPIIILLGIIGFTIQKNKQIPHYIFPITMLAFWCGAFLLRSWIIFPNVGAFEQGNYPTRLLASSMIFIAPFAMYAVYRLISFMIVYLKTKKNRTKYIIYILNVTAVSCVLTISFYLSYPQENFKVHFPGYNVAQSDFKAAEWINNDNLEYNYIVLSNPMTAVAAMTKYGFPKYFDIGEEKISYYSIPSGGPMFKLYQRMLYEDQKREYMNEAMDLAGIKKAYFTVSSYWTQFDKIIQGAKQTADSWHVIDDGKIWIFTYSQTDS